MSLLHRQNIRLVIFDFDGTIADTSEGILDSHRFALETMGRDIPSEKTLRGVIGGNLLKTYINTFKFQEEKAREAVRIYRERYASVGIHRATLYSGFTDLLIQLKEAGLKIGVATLKAEKFATIMLKDMGIDMYFDEVCGMDMNDNLDKAGLIQKCVDLCGCSLEDTILVGDSMNDWEGAQKANVGFIGVSYGFGFSKEETYPFIIRNSPQEIVNYIFE